MKIDIVDSLTEFQALKGNFDFVYSADSKARFFASWIWLSRTLKQYDEYHEPWFILAAKPDEESAHYVAFLSLKLELCEDKNGCFDNQLFLAGINDADHTPFISLPDYQNEAASAFAAYLCQREEWSAFNLENIQLRDERFCLFVRQFSTNKFDYHEQYHVNDLDSIDNNIIPFIALPNDWETYLQSDLSSNSRQRVKRFLRKVEGSDEYRITQANANNLERHIEILSEFWTSSWAGRKGKDKCQTILGQIKASLRHCSEHNCLYFPVLWKGDRPLGTIANIIDHAQKTMLFFIGGRDETIKDLPSGIVLHAHSIRYAIQQGFKVYDFLMGNEAYKFSFGAQERHIGLVCIQRKEFVNSARKLDVRTIPHALHIATAYHRDNQLIDAEHRYRQILATQPVHPDALYGLGVVLQRQENYPAAETVLRTLLDVQPDHARAWFSLGTLHQTQEHLKDAETAYRHALEVEAEASVISLAVYHNLGYILQQQGAWEEAIAYYEKARLLQPESPEAEVMWANAMHAHGQLSPDACSRYAEINHALGNRRRQAGDVKVAIEYFRQAIAMQPTLTTAHYHLGVALQKLDKWEEAIACYQTALLLQPDYREAEANIASVRHTQGTLTPGQQKLYATLCTELGIQYQQKDDVDTAIQFYRQAIVLQPDLATAHYHLGVALQGKGEWKEAITCYEATLDIQPSNRDADTRLAALLHTLGKLPAEKTMHYALLNHELGDRYKQAGDLKSAIEHYQWAIAMNPALVDVRGQLRLALQEQHNVHIKVSCEYR